MTAKALRYGLLIGLAAFAACYLMVVGCNVVTIYSEAVFDEQLFMNLGTALVQRRWLGDYDKLTLVKGPGYPFFLAINFRLGLPINLGQGLAYLAATAGAGFTILRITKSQTLGLLLVVALLFVPAMYFTPARIIRDYFYTSLTLIFFSSLLLLVFDQSRVIRFMSALIAGFGAAAIWLTREEGLWIVPATLLAFVIAIVSAERGAKARHASLFGLALTCAALSICSVGAVNAYVYGRFVISELKDSDFQSALGWLQRASYSHWRPYLGVPREARMEIYHHSPTFASLKAFLDPTDQPSPWDPGCAYFPNTCGDIANGWFLWALRDGATRAGAYTSPDEAARFYRAIAVELKSVCDAGQLDCARWYPSFLPPMTMNQLTSLHRHFISIMSSTFLLQPVHVRPAMSVIDPARRDVTLRFLNHPPIAEPEGMQGPAACTEVQPIQSAWMRFVETIQPIFAVVFFAGVVAFAVVALLAWRSSIIPTAALAGSILAAAILTRSAILTLIDASSFPAAGYHYVLPAVPLLLMFSLLSLSALLARWPRHWLTRPDGSPQFPGRH
jgi:hypothetical protein